MISKFSIVAFLAATTLGSAIPADNQNAVSKRQDDWNIWFVHLLVMRPHLRSRALIFMHTLILWLRKLNLYTSGCDDEPTEFFSGHDDQTFPCAGGIIGWHNAKMDNLEATGHKVILYSDASCVNEIGQVKKDGTCYSSPSDVSETLGYCVATYFKG
jgi:hypothetical protein